jgi:hypothetical protein
LGPISLTAAGVTVIVFGGVIVTKKAIESVRRRRKRIERCTDMFVTCQNERPWSCTRIIHGSETLCGICRDNCQDKIPYYSSECYQCGFSDPN